MKLKKSVALVTAVVASLCSTAVLAGTELVIATVNNGHMIEMQKLSKNFEQANPDITLKCAPLLVAPPITC